MIRSEDELLSILHAGKCALFGAGDYARSVLAYAINNGVDIDRLFVTDVKNNTCTIWGATVLHIKEYKDRLDDTSLIVCVNESLHNEIAQVLKEMSIKNVYYVSNNLVRCVKQKYSNPIFSKRKEMQLLILNILDHCNLRCAGCDHFACIASEYTVPFSTLENDVRRMKKIMGNTPIREISIMGGETLLHPDLPQIMEMVRSNFPDSMLRVTTNGLLLLNQKDSFWDSCRRNKATVIVTRYPINLNFAAIKEKVKQEKVDFLFFEGTDEDVEKGFSKHIINLNGTENREERFGNCGIANYGNFLMEGKLYGCPFSCQAYRIFNQKYHEKLVISENDFIDIYKAQNADELLEFAATPKNFCKYCGGLVGGGDWRRSKQERCEWVNE